MLTTRESSLLVALLLCVFLPTGEAKCHNSCSGHGSCGSDGRCACSTGWDVVGDCSWKSCPSGAAWFDKATNTTSAHRVTECSNNGVCNYQTGLCKCSAGFTGASCDRSSCPNSCNGHGTCESLYDVGRYDGVVDSSTNARPQYVNWESRLFSMCRCDWGYTGGDCSYAMCPKGNNPRTINQFHRSINLWTGAAGSGRLTGNFVLDVAGHSVIFNADADNVPENCADSFTDLLSNVVESNCTRSGVDPSSGGAMYSITFLRFQPYPLQNNIHYHSGAPDLSQISCSTSGVTSANLPSCNITVTGYQSTTASKYVEYDYCSGSGICNFKTGVCKCFSGFEGAACSQNATAVYYSDNEPGLLVEGTVQGLAYTGSVLKLKTAKAAQTDFKFFEASANAIEVLKIDGTGHLDTIGGITVTKGGLTVKDNGIHVLAGGINVEANGITVKDGTTTLSVSDSSLTILDIKANNSAYAGTLAMIQTNRSEGTDFKLLSMLAGGGELFGVRGDGRVTAQDIGGKSLSLTSLFEEGVTTITPSGMTLTDGVVSIHSKSPAGDVVVIEAGNHTSYNGSVLRVRSARDESNFNETQQQVKLIEGSSGERNVFTLASDGVTTIHQGGLYVEAGGATVYGGGLRVAAGGALVNAGGLTVEDGGITTSNSGGTGLTVSNGGAYIQHPADNGIVLNVKSTASNFVNSVLRVEATSTASGVAFDLITGVTDGSTHFAVKGNGDLTAGKVYAQDGIENSTIGAVAPSTGAFTSLTSSETLTFNGISGANRIKMQDNQGDALRIEDTSGAYFMQFISTTGQKELVINQRLRVLGDIITSGADFGEDIVVEKLTASHGIDNTTIGATNPKDAAFQSLTAQGGAFTGDVTLYKATNDGNPTLSIGSSSANRLTVTGSYNSGTQTLEKVVFDTTTSTTGTYEFKIGGTSELQLTGSTLDLASGSSYQIASTGVLSSTTLGSGVLASSLTSVGTLASLAVAGDVTTGGDVTTYKAVNDGNPVVSLGSAAANRLLITAAYTGGAQTLASIDFDTASAAAGTYKFKIKGTQELALTGTALDLATGSTYQIGSTNVLTATALGGAVVGSSLTSVGTLTSVSVSGATTLNGDVNLGNAISDTITVTGATTFANGYQQSPTTVAAAGSNQGDSTAVTAGLSMLSITSTGGSQGVKLPTASIGQIITLVRVTATNVVLIYPNTGGYIDAGVVNAALSMTAATKVVVCVGISTTAWECQRQGAGAIISSRRRRLLLSTDGEEESAPENWKEEVLELRQKVAEQQREVAEQKREVAKLQKQMALLLSRSPAAVIKNRM